MMDDLIKILEGATEGSQELDARIYCAVNGKTFVKAGPNGSIHFLPDKNGVHTMLTPHPYTTSLDAAVSLVPEGHRLAQLWEAVNVADRPWWGCTITRDEPRYATFQALGCPTSAIAVSTAAMKALKARNA